jgi:hypothetical protein
MNTSNVFITPIPRVWASTPIGASFFPPKSSRDVLMAMLKEGVSHAHAIPRFVFILSREGEFVHSASDAIDIMRDMIANEMRHSTDDWWQECANNYADCNPHQPGWEAKRAIDGLDWASVDWKAELYKELQAKDLIISNQSPQVYQLVPALRPLDRSTPVHIWSIVPINH